MILLEVLALPAGFALLALFGGVLYLLEPLAYELLYQLGRLAYKLGL